MENPRSLWPYSPRSGADAARDLDILLNEPELTLSPQEQEELKTYGEALLAGYVSEDLQVPAEDGQRASLAEVTKSTVTDSRVDIYAGYIQDEAGRDAVAELIGEPTSAEVLARTLYAQIAMGEKVDRATIKKLAARSETWYKNQITVQSGDEETAAARELADGDIVQVNVDPAALLRKTAQLQHYRSFYRQAWRAEKSSGDDAGGSRPAGIARAKMTLAELHMAKANASMALLYPALLQLADQLAGSPRTELTTAWAEEIGEVAPALQESLGKNIQDRAGQYSRFARRLDLIRNGAGESVDSAGIRLPVSQESKGLAEVIERRRVSELSADDWDWDGTPPIELLPRWNADKTKKLIEYVLDEWGLLSAEPVTWEDYQERQGPAADGRWQVVISPRGSLMTVGKKKALEISDDFDRELLQASPAGALPVAAHELAHVLQNEAEEALKEQLPLAGAGGRRALVLREMGGIYYERKVFEAFGLERNANTTYLRALEAKLDGGNHSEVAGAFYETRMRDGISSPAQARKAAGAFLRLYRHYGENSQPLDYLEQDLLLSAIVDKAPERAGKIALSAAVFSLPDAARLHSIGMYDLSEGETRDPADSVLRQFRAHF
jgi:hypothetical protein